MLPTIETLVSIIYAIRHDKKDDDETSVGTGKVARNSSRLVAAFSRLKSNLDLVTGPRGARWYYQAKLYFAPSSEGASSRCVCSC